MDKFGSIQLPVNHKCLKHFRGMNQAHLIGINEHLIPTNGPEILREVEKFKCREDDIFLATFPKTGTTWMQEIIYLMVKDIKTDFNTTNVKQVFPHLESRVFDFANDSPILKHPSFLELADSVPSQRLISTHLPYSLLPPDAIDKKCKIIYLSRNAADTITSYFHFSKQMTFMDFEGNMEDFFNLILDDKIPYAPFITHVKEYWQRHENSNVFFTTYEELKRDQKLVIGKLAKFLDKTLTPEEIGIVAECCKFENMKHHLGVSNNFFVGQRLAKSDNFKFMRKGVVGDWKNYFTPEMKVKLQEWIANGSQGINGLQNILEKGFIY